MGGLGSDAAIKISKKTLKIAYLNIWFAIEIKVMVLILNAIGVTTRWKAMFVDVCVIIIAILNSFRALNVKKL